MRNLLGILLALTIVALSCIQHAAAAIVFLRDSDQPIAGVIQLEDEHHIVIQQQMPDGELRTRDILRSDIEDIIVTVSAQRLEGLTPDAPNAYRNYAEELAEKRKDPEAAAVSLRLYVIAAYLKPDTLGRSSLLGMLTLASSPEEQRKYRAMAYLLDPQHDKRILQEPGQTAPSSDAVDKDHKLVRIAALRAARRGDRRTLTTMLTRPSVREALQNWPGGLSYDEFTELPDELPDETLARLLQLELSLARQTVSDDPQQKKRTDSWSRIVAQDGDGPVPSLTLETITKYDPRQCVFRDGKWVEP